MERTLTGLLDTREYHTDYPEEDDIITGYQHIRRIEILQFLCLLRPAQRRERPQCGREPGIQRILILLEVSTSALRTFLRHGFCYHNLTALLAVVSRNPVSPPQLTGNAPVTDAFQPVQIRLAEAFRNKLQFAALQRFDRRFCHLLHTYKPLLLYHRLNGSLASVMSTYIMRMRNHLHQQSQIFQILHHRLTCFIAIHSVVFAAWTVNGRIVMHDAQLRQVVASSHLKVVRVMSRGNLHAAGTEFLIHILIRNHRNLAIGKWQLQHLANQILITFILRINCYCRITQQSFRTGRCNLNKSALFSDNRIIDMPEKTILLLMLYLGIGNRGLADRAPVDDAGAFINISFFIQLDKYFQYRIGTSCIHRKTLSVPVCGRTKLMKLIDDAGTILLLPVPACFQKAVTSQIMFVDAFASQLVNNLYFGRDRCVIRARLPECLIALHPFVTGQNILHGIVQRMTHVQLTGDVRRRHHNRKRFLAFSSSALCVSMKVLVVQPFLIQLFFNGGRIISFL